MGLLNRILSFDPEFSEFNYGFRPGKHAGQAIQQALTYINQGYRYIVDIDLKSFFDEVNHDYLMNLIKRKVSDPLVLRLLWKYLRSPVQSKPPGQLTGLSAGSPGLSKIGSTYWLMRRKAQSAGHSNTSISDLRLNRVTSEESEASTNGWYQNPVGQS